MWVALPPGAVCGKPRACRAHMSRKIKRVGNKGTNRPPRLTIRRGESTRPSPGAGVALPGVCWCACIIVCNCSRRGGSASCRSTCSGTGGLQTPPLSPGPWVPGRHRPESPGSGGDAELPTGRPPSQPPYNCYRNTIAQGYHTSLPQHCLRSGKRSPSTQTGQKPTASDNKNDQRVTA